LHCHSEEEFRKSIRVQILRGLTIKPGCDNLVAALSEAPHLRHTLRILALQVYVRDCPYIDTWAIAYELGKNHQGARSLSRLLVIKIHD
jgi:hypothetical protein